MADYLVIVESPAKAKTIGKYLGKRFVVKASMGHVRDLPKSQLGVDVKDEFQPKYITIRGKGSVMKELRDSSRKVKKVYLAADPDREGEAIAWHLANMLDIDPAAPCRVVFNEITKQAVNDAFKNPRQIDMSLVNAQQARRILDRLVGYQISPLLWKKVRKGLSAGRVQSVAVRLIVDREKEIRAFVPIEYWSVVAEFNVDGKMVEAKFYGYHDRKTELHSEDDVNALLTHIKELSFRVEDVKRSERRRHPSAPFTTSSMQQEGARKLNFRAQKTMSVAQQLYEGLDVGKEGTVGLITYMRTDSTRVSVSALDEVRAFIGEHYGEAYRPTEPREYPTRNSAQDAHEAVRPTSVTRHPDEVKAYLSRDQYRLYRLIWERFVASQMTSAIMDTVTVDIRCNDAKWRATGSTIKFAGFMVLYVEGNDEGQEEVERLLPDISPGLALTSEHIKPKQHFTEPPPRYTEARLVKSMEELGIGRPSTYAPTLETIQKRGYVLLEERKFTPTELGEIVVQLLMEFFSQIIDVEFTAHMEQNLDDIEEGSVDWISMLEEFYGPFEGELRIAEEHMASIQLVEEVSEEPCEKCGRMLVYKHGRYGKFLACPGFPECRNAKPIRKEVGVSCPKCSGQLVERRGKRRRLFYGCEHYPDCDYVLWDRPIMRNCPTCSHPLVVKRVKKTMEHVICANPECTYQEEPTTVTQDQFENELMQ